MVSRKHVSNLCKSPVKMLMQSVSGTIVELVSGSTVSVIIKADEYSTGWPATGTALTNDDMYIYIGFGIGFGFRYVFGMSLRCVWAHCLGHKYRPLI